MATALAGNAHFNNMEISVLRQTKRQQRRAISAQQQSLAARALGKRLALMPQFVGVKRIAVYLASDGEIDPNEFVQWAWAQNIECYLPILDKNQQHVMRFGLYHSASELVLNRFKIPEPKVGVEQQLAADHLDVILLPLVAFDLSGNRMGMGGGYYDRVLAFKSQLSYHSRPMLLGIAHELQRVMALNPTKWDVPLEGVVTPERTLIFDQPEL